MNEGSAPDSTPELTPEEITVLDGLVTSLVQVQRGISAFEGLRAELLHAAHALGLSRVDLSRRDGDLPIREVAAEIAAALRVSDRTVQRQLAQATTLTGRFPATHDALTAGRITRAHVAVILEAGDRIEDDEMRAAFEAEVLPIAERESASRLARFARLCAERLLPRTFAERHEDAAASRGVAITDLDDGMSELCLQAPSTLVHGIHDRLTAQAQSIHSAEPDDARTLDQLRADLLCELALTGTAHGNGPAEVLSSITAEVHISVPALTLAGASTEPALLDGVQPIDTDTALRLVGAASGWERVLTHPATGAVLAVDRYRPSSQLRRHLKALDERCRFPGCMILARHCDIDHVQDAARGGPTEHGNLSDTCRRHHVLKHHSAWAVSKSRDGTVTWTSPTGRSYPDRVTPRVAFVPEYAHAQESPGAPPGADPAPF